MGVIVMIVSKSNTFAVPKERFINLYSAVILSILPILYPYAIIGSISINMVLMFMSIVYLIFSKTRFDKSNVLPITLLFSGHCILSLFAAFTWTFSMSLINSLLITAISVLTISLLWSRCKFDTFFRVANFIGIFSSLFLFLQAIMLGVGMEPFSGKIPFLGLLDYASFVSTTWGFRLNSIFQEPSYFAIYCLPLLATNLRENKWIVSLLYIFALVLSSSSLGILGAVIIVLYHIMFERRKVKDLVILFGTVVVSHLFFYNLIPYYARSFNRSLEKLAFLSENSDIRFSGQAYLFNNMSIINQIFGVGLNQMENFFIGYGDIYNYSNSFVIALVTTGILGLAIYILFIMYSASFSLKNKRIVFFVIFIMVASIDYFIYSALFFYLLTFIYLKEKVGAKNENIICYS